LSVLEENIAAYNSAASSINSCLQSMKLYDHFLPIIGDSFDGDGKFANNEFLVSDVV
jgi:hypothetical protein